MKMSSTLSLRSSIASVDSTCLQGSTGTSRLSYYAEEYPETFLDLLKDSPYYDVAQVPATYSVFLDTLSLHRKVWVKLRRSDKPYYSFEIMTDAGCQVLLPGNEIVPNLKERAALKGAKDVLTQGYRGGAETLYAVVGTPGFIRRQIDRWTSQNPNVGIQRMGYVTTSIREMCEKAERVREQMGRYRFVRSNCQHFCNNFLAHHGLQTCKTTIGPRTTTVQVELREQEEEEEEEEDDVRYTNSSIHSEL